MTKAEFADLIEKGSDILFDVAGQHLVIFTWMDEGIGISKQDSDEPFQHFADANALLDGYKIGDLTLAQLCDKVVITDYS